MESSADVVILTALPVEFKAVTALLRDQSVLVHPEGTRFVRGALPGVAGTVAVSRVGVGNVTAAIITERARQWLRPQALLFVGVAGGLKAEAALGDVVVSTKVHQLHSGKETPTGFTARPVPGAVSHALEQAAGIALRTDAWYAWIPDAVRETWHGRAPQVHFQPVIAGEVVLNSENAPLRDQIKAYYGDALAIEMESAGVAGAAQLSRDLQILTLRGISDHADRGKADADASGSQHRASAHAAAAAAALLGELLSAEAAGAGTSRTAPPAAGVAGPPTPDRALVNALLAFDDMASADFRHGLLVDMGRVLGLSYAFMAAESPVARDHVREIVRRVNTYRDPSAARVALYTVLEDARPDDAALEELSRLLP
ncbi:effector-associated domain 2-containing protein [Streptomyces sp. YU58]|uniref:phosphorylase family protein n=1 Tax=Streptomyces sp. SX92 TaxID=3158972 RepID=UPI0027B8A6CF|nr:nucleosidase [Streptomyces coralus]WLW52066.1 nucleosidase [Streptomyces coralus]